MREHTKTPWFIGKSLGGFDTVACLDVKKPDQTAIAFTVCRDGRNIIDAEKDMKHIVRCVNNFDKMLEALKAVEEAYSNYTIVAEKTGAGSVINKVREAIEKAEKAGGLNDFR